MELPKRKSPRMPGYDYRTNGAYFVTVCTKNKIQYFGDVGRNTKPSRMIEKTFLEIIKKYPQVACPVYKVMPNHFHAIIEIQPTTPEAAPTLSEIIREFKRYSMGEYIRLVKAGNAIAFEGKLWQRSFHDHVIRNQAAYEKIWNYIQYNDQKWEDDCFHPDFGAKSIDQEG